MRRMWNFNLTPIKRHLPYEALAYDRIDVHISPQQVASNQVSR
jgi:hypothetical protein